MYNKFLTDKGFDFDNCKSTKYWSIKTRIEYIQRKIIICCMIYYQLNSSIMTDNEYTIICKQLKQMIKENPDVFKQTRYYYCFKDFDVSTGFDLYNKLNKADKKYLHDISCMLLNRGK